MNLNALSEADLNRLTGCNYQVIWRLEKALLKLLSKKRGRHYQYPVRIMLITTLIKLKSDLTYRAMESLFKIAYVTLSRYTLTVCRLLSKQLANTARGYHYLIVDSTGGRVRSQNKSDYSGYKHYTGRKVQAVINDTGEIVSISPCYSGSVHDKRIWNNEFKKLTPDKIILGDKGYAGGKGEFSVLFRPIRRNEQEYKADKEKAKAYNRELSKIRVKVEHVFAQLKTNKIVSGIFPLKSNHYGLVMAALATIHNVKLQVKNAK